MLKARLGKMLRLVSKPTNQTPEESTSEDCCQFQQLPDELLIAIFKHLDRPVLFNARGVCSRWNKLTLRYMQNSFPVVQVSSLQTFILWNFLLG
jgi:hypothetical protein